MEYYIIYPVGADNVVTRDPDVLKNHVATGNVSFVDIAERTAEGKTLLRGTWVSASPDAFHHAFPEKSVSTEPYTKYWFFQKFIPGELHGEPLKWFPDNDETQAMVGKILS